MKTSTTNTLLALLLLSSITNTILSAKDNTTPIENTTTITDKPVICELPLKLQGKTQTVHQNLISKHQGKRIIYSSLGIICFQ